VEKNSFYLITGVMASGKSTVAEALARRFQKGVHVRGDVFRRMIVSGREEMSAQPSPTAIQQLRLRYDLAAQVARMYFDQGFSVVLQDNYYGEELANMLKRLDGYPVRAVVLQPRVAVVAQREQQREKRGYIGFEVESLYEAFVKDTPRLGFWLDNSDCSVEQTVDAILAHFDGQK
jgi:predicted kinase